MYVYLRTKFEDFSVNLTSFRQGEGGQSPQPKNEPLESPFILGSRGDRIYGYIKYC